MANTWTQFSAQSKQHLSIGLDITPASNALIENLALMATKHCDTVELF